MAKSIQIAVISPDNAEQYRNNWVKYNLITPSKVPALKGIPQPMSASRRPPSTSRSTATSVNNKTTLAVTLNKAKLQRPRMMMMMMMKKDKLTLAWR